MLFSTAYIAVLGFASYTCAHMLLAKPPAADGVINSPLNADGSNFPCQLKFTSSSAATSMALGSTQPLAFTGGATHGGGSCQISITYDDPPTKNSVFKVIHSIIGGCPVKNNAGNIGTDASSPDPDTYSFTMPTNLPTGKATLAWTWFNKVGNREMYMNCANIDITAGSSKRSEDEENLARNITQLMERDQSAFNSLPDMFTANIKNIGNDGCGTKETIDTVFPNPGSSVDRPGLQANYGPPVGTCNGGSGSSGSAASSGSASTPTSAAASASTSSAAQGGVFATTAAASSAVTVPTTMATSIQASAAATSAAPVASASASPTASSGATGTMTAGSACSPEGLWNCIGGTSFQQCASGTWSVVESLAAGTQCTPGQSSTINITAAKRAIRFSSEHVRRHIQRST
jgi:hypothetical protein